MSDQDVSSTGSIETSYEELFGGSTPSTQHRMFFKRFGRLEPVKGEFVRERLPKQAPDDKRVFARLFKYVIEGPPYARVPTAAEVTQKPVDPARSVTKEAILGTPTRFEVTQINAIHAREDVIANSAFRPSVYGPGFQVVWSEVEGGAPEYEFAQALVSAFESYDDLVASCETYEEWQERHQAFLGRALHWRQAVAEGKLKAEPDGTFSMPEPEEIAASGAQLAALNKLYSPSNVDMELRFRATRHENWEAKIAPTQPAPTQAPAQADPSEVMASLGAKLKEFSETCSPEEQEILKNLGQVAVNPAMVAGPDPHATSFVGKLARAFGGGPPQPGDMSRPGFALPPVGGQPNFPFQKEEWVELSPGSFGPGGPGLSQQLADFAQDFAGPGVQGPGTIQDVIAGESQAQGYRTLPWGLPPGAPGYPGPYPGMLGGAFAPGPDESFTMGDGVEGQAQRQLDAATAEADALRARLHADANENSRKVGLFKDVVAGGLRFLLEKLEGPAEPVGDEPVGPIEQGWGRAGVNGGRAGVMSELQEQLASFTPRPQTQPFVAPPVTPGASGLGAPGEKF